MNDDLLRAAEEMLAALFHCGSNLDDPRMRAAQRALEEAVERTARSALESVALARTTSVTDNLIVTLETERSSCSFCHDRSPRPTIHFVQRHGYGVGTAPNICGACLTELWAKGSRLLAEETPK